MRFQDGPFREQMAAIIESLSPEAQEPFQSCCYGAAIYGPARCTCWTPEYDRPQSDATDAAAPEIIKCCGDCAYRADSPERSGVSGYACSAEAEGELPDVARGGFFFCHQGMRRVVAYVHSETGFRADIDHGDDYAPGSHEGRPILANGDYAPLCAGFAASRGVTTEYAHKRLLSQHTSRKKQ